MEHMHLHIFVIFERACICQSDENGGYSKPNMPIPTTKMFFVVGSQYEVHDMHLNCAEVFQFEWHQINRYYHWTLFKNRFGIQNRKFWMWRKNNLEWDTTPTNAFGYVSNMKVSDQQKRAKIPQKKGCVSCTLESKRTHQNMEIHILKKYKLIWFAILNTQIVVCSALFAPRQQHTTATEIVTMASYPHAHISKTHPRATNILA